LRYFFHIAYHGSNYSGWQKHPGARSVQQIIETALSKILKVPTAINGCGRTDALVHAAQYFFHTDINFEWDFDLFFRLNKVLPDDIAVFEIIPMNGQPHARFDAVKRTYNYFIHTYKDPFLGKFSSYYAHTQLDFEAMKAAVALLPLYTDYRGLCKCPDRIEHTLCFITDAKLFIDETGDRLRFQITSNRFLSRMVRIIVGRLLEVGKGTLSIAEFESCLIEKRTPAIIIPAHPQGLYLTKVIYPYLDIEPCSTFLPGANNRGEADWLSL